MTTIAHNQTWRSNADGLTYVALRPNVTMKQQDGTTAAGVVYMLESDVKNAVPNAPLYCDTEANFQANFTFLA